MGRKPKKNNNPHKMNRMNAQQQLIHVLKLQIKELRAKRKMVRNEIITKRIKRTKNNNKIMPKKKGRRKGRTHRLNTKEILDPMKIKMTTLRIREHLKTELMNINRKVCQCTNSLWKSLRFKNSLFMKSQILHRKK